MGLLTQGDTLLSWADTKKNAAFVRQLGVQQFIAAFKRGVQRKEDPFKWGDEVILVGDGSNTCGKALETIPAGLVNAKQYYNRVEVSYAPRALNKDILKAKPTNMLQTMPNSKKTSLLEFCLLTVNTDKETAQLSLLGPSILALLEKKEHEDPNFPSSWTPEYARYMIEATPSKPYGSSLSEIMVVEENMKIRWQQLRDILLESGEASTFPLTLSVFPRMGCPGFTSPEYEPRPKTSVMKSLFYPDEVVVQPEEQKRFMAVTENLHLRRKDKHSINVPVFKDTNTPTPFREVFPPESGIAALQDHIYMDCIAFGPGCSCIQVTCQAPDIDEARYLYDQFLVLGPLLLALTAGSPIYRGYLANVDCRWDVIANAVDDRTPGERGLEPPESNELFIPKSRWATAECYIANDAYNDTYVPNDPEVFQQLKDGGVDDLLARHISYLFIRDPLILFSSDLHQDPNEDTGLFENILTSNWQSLRFKPPKPEIDAGWRVEVRTMDHHITPSEDAAIAVFVMLLARMIMTLKPSLYIPMSKVDENMRQVQKVGALHHGKFFFCRNLFPEAPSSPAPSAHYSECELMDANTIFNGKDGFPGLLALLKEYLECHAADVDPTAKAYTMKVMKFISMKASGELMTTAAWIRQFVLSHPEYKRDSKVTEKISYDLIMKMKLMAEGHLVCPELTGDLILP